MSLQGCVVLLQRGSLPLQGKDLGLLAVRLTLQLSQLGLRSLALCLQCRILEGRGEDGENMLTNCLQKEECKNKAL